MGLRVPGELDNPVAMTSRSRLPAMANRIDTCFQSLRERGQTGFIAFVTCGDPNLATTLEILGALERAGVDLIELGIPFSDPLADGATIQAASGRALDSGTSVRGVLDLVASHRKSSQIPIVLFTYLNPIFTFGVARFFKDAAAAGADGVLVLDLPPDESEVDAVDRCGLRAIRLIAPTTPPARIESLAAASEGFIYYVSREGVTGEQAELSTTIADQVAAIREHSPLPIAVGFGISTPAQAAAVAENADAVVVGSAIVRCIAECGDSPDVAARVEAFTKPLVDACRANHASE